MVKKNSISNDNTVSLHETAFKDRVIAIVKAIPPGQTLSYKEVATLAGNPGAARAVGNIMSRNREIDVPCHRVLGSSGKPGGYAFGIEKKSEMLDYEKETKKSYPQEKHPLSAFKKFK